MQKFNLTREKYRTIKGYNKVQMENFLQEIFNGGYNSGISDMSKELADRVDKGIRNTDGIGEKRYQALISNINKELNREDC